MQPALIIHIPGLYRRKRTENKGEGEDARALAQQSGVQKIKCLLSSLSFVALCVRHAWWKCGGVSLLGSPIGSPIWSPVAISIAALSHGVLQEKTQVKELRMMCDLISLISSNNELSSASLQGRFDRHDLVPAASLLLLAHTSITLTHSSSHSHVLRLRLYDGGDDAAAAATRLDPVWDPV